MVETSHLRRWIHQDATATSRICCLGLVGVLKTYRVARNRSGFIARPQFHLCRLWPTEAPNITESCRAGWGWATEPCPRSTPPIPTRRASVELVCHDLVELVYTTVLVYIFLRGVGVWQWEEALVGYIQPLDVRHRGRPGSWVDNSTPWLDKGRRDAAEIEFLSFLPFLH